MTTVHVVMCTVGDYTNKKIISVRACRTVERASQLVGELNEIHDREVDDIPYPRCKRHDEGYSREEEEEKYHEYERKRDQAYERVCEVYRNEYGIKIPETCGRVGINFWMLESVLED